MDEFSPETPDRLEANKNLVRRYFEMWNTGDAAAADSLLAGTYVDHALPAVVGPAAVRALVPRFRAQNPDARMILESETAEADRVSVRLAIVHVRDGRELVARGTVSFRIGGDRLVEQWSEYPGPIGVTGFPEPSTAR